MAIALEYLIENRIPGKTLARDFYVSAAVFEEDLRRVFGRNWLFAGHTCEIPEPGDYFVFPIGDESLLIVRDKNGQIHAHFNVCRHRGSRIALEPCGHARTLVCPYHQWVYALDGSLTNARLMGENFNTEEYRLRSAHVQEVAGLIFVCLAPDPPDFIGAVEAIEPQLRPHGFAGAKIIHRESYEVRANWKTIFENNRECYHCRVNHPEFCASNYDLGLPGDVRNKGAFDEVREGEYERWRALGLSPREVNFPDGAPYRVSRLPLKEGYLTESMDGRLVAPLMGDLTDPRTGSLRIIMLPNFWAHADCDHAMTTRLTPVRPDLTRVDVCFLVRKDAIEGADYDLSRVTHVWRATSEQDWELCENNYAGIRSLAYEPGPYSTVTEKSVEQFVDWYLDQLSGAEPAAVHQRGDVVCRVY